MLTYAKMPRIFMLFLLVSSMLVKVSQSQCSGLTCRECISSGYTCSWCRQANFTGPRCQPQRSLTKSGCLDTNIENPQSLKYNIQNDEVKDSDKQDDSVIQIQPQKVKIITRPREEHKIPMTFRAANNFPVDLYFLFDNSNTMDPQIKTLAKLAENIGQSISSISSNYRMGYGVFQDKVILPFTDTVSEKLENPCFSKGSKEKCNPPFEFKHLLNMTENIAEFKKMVDGTGVTGNIDQPEGSIDAIVQAITCKTQIGWRSRGRKLLIFATNDRFHLAGDGRLAGIVIPNDGQCHLNAEGKYEKELIQDYPTISQLTDIVEKNEVYIIFAVPSDQISLFELLQKRVGLSQSTVELLENPDTSSNNRTIKDIIEQKYKEIVSEVEIIHTPVKGVDVQIKATSDPCIQKGTNKCKGLEIGTRINFDVEIKVTECPSNPAEQRKEITIYPENIKTDKMVLDIEIICECNCDSNATTWEINSSKCSEGNGTLKCGVCDCNKNRFGQFCECDATDLGPSTAGCKKPGENSTCSGVGKCECGLCHCDAGYSGPYCECNDRACGVFQNEICGGARGQCVCGACQCESKYTGGACECPLENTTCILDEKVCNEAGNCECGECKCTKTGFVGKYCEKCVLCGETCDEALYRQCAQCAVSNKEEKQDCPKDCPDTQVVDSIKNINGSRVCSIKQADGCFLQFVITSVENSLIIHVQKTAVCPEPVNIVPIAAGVVGGVVAIGLLLLLLWKILTTIFDKIEYSKFEEALKHGKWAQQENPFYKPATTTYKNLMREENDAPKE